MNAASNLLQSKSKYTILLIYVQFCIVSNSDLP